MAFGPPAITWGGSEGAVLVSEATGTGWSINLARFNGQGISVGSPVSVGSSMASSFPPPTLGLATNGAVYLACWDDAMSAVAGVACATIPTGSGSATVAAYTDTGTAPSLAYSGAGFVLADVTSGGAINIQQLTAAGAANGTPFTGGTATLPVITPRAGGYAVASVASSGALTDVYLDSSGVVGQELDTFSSSPGIGDPFALATSGMATAAVWYGSGNTMGVFSAIRGTGTQASPVLISGTGMSYGRVSVAGGNNSYAATWSDVSSIMYVPLDATGTPTAAATSALNAGWDDNANALTTVADGFVLASTMNPSNNTLQLVHLGCP